MKKLKLTTKEKITLVKEGYIEIQRGIFTIVITRDYLGMCEIMVINPYDIDQLNEDINTMEIVLR